MMNPYDFSLGTANDDFAMGSLGTADMAQGDALYTATQSLLTALSNAPGYPAVTPCSNTASAASAFQGAYNVAPAIPNTVAPSTGVYDSGTQVALQASINAYQALSPPVSFTSGSAPPPCSAGGSEHRPKPPPVVTPPVVELPADVTAPLPTVSTPVVQPVPAPPPDSLVVQPPAIPPPPPPPSPTVPAPSPPAPPPPPPPVVDMGFQEYVVQPGDSPEFISRRFRIPFQDLIRANPHKPVVHAGRGIYTWRTIGHGERLRVPVRRPVHARGRLAGTVGDDATSTRSPVSFQRDGAPAVSVHTQLPISEGDALVFRAGNNPQAESATRSLLSAQSLVSAATSLASATAQTLAAVNPCDQASAGLVEAFQRSVGQNPDSKYGTETAKALAALVPGAPAGCHPRPAWWGAPQAPQGSGNMTTRYVPPPPMHPAHVPPPPPMVAAYVPPPVHRYVAPPAYGYSNVPPPVPLELPFSQRHYVRMASQYDAPPALPDVPAPPPATDQTPAAPPPAALPASMSVPQPPPVVAPDEESKPGLSKNAIIAGGVATVALVAVLAAVATSGPSRKPDAKSTMEAKRTRRRGVNRTSWSGHGADGHPYHILRKPSGYSLFRTDLDGEDSFVESFRTLSAAKKYIGV